MPRRRYTDQQILNAIERSRGLVFLAAQALGCDPATIHHRAQKNDKIREAIEIERGRILDFAEAKLLEAVRDGAAWAICFLLKTQARSRGYVERQEVTTSQKVAIVRDAEELSDDELAAIATGRGRVATKETTS